MITVRISGMVQQRNLTMEGDPEATHFDGDLEGLREIVRGRLVNGQYGRSRRKPENYAMHLEGDEAELFRAPGLGDMSGKPVAASVIVFLRLSEEYGHPVFTVVKMMAASDVGAFAGCLLPIQEEQLPAALPSAPTATT